MMRHPYADATKECLIVNFRAKARQMAREYFVDNENEPLATFPEHYQRFVAGYANGLRDAYEKAEEEFQTCFLKEWE